MKREKDISQLFTAFINNTCSESEIDRLLLYFGHPESKEKLAQLVYLEFQKRQDNYPDEVNNIVSRVDLLLKDKIRSVPKKKNTIPYYWSAAAVLLIGLAVAVWQYRPINKGYDATSVQTLPEQVEEPSPGGSHARLLLSDGKILTLDGSRPLTDNYKGAAINCHNGQLSYVGTKSSSHAVKWNVLEVPKGGTFEMKLPDGTKVWLNANSKLYFPDQFATGERNVKIEGEAFFDVVKDVNRPFKVAVNGLHVTVLGTSFNIRSYHPKHVSTTLITGSVEARYQNRTLKLLPGKKVMLNTDNGDFGISDADIESAIAWKEGYFYFKDEGLATILQDVAFWYDLKVSVEGTLPNRHYSGSIDRNSKLSGVLSMISSVSGAKFLLEGKKLIVKFNKT